MTETLNLRQKLFRYTKMPAGWQLFTTTSCKIAIFTFVIIRRSSLAATGSHGEQTPE